MRRRKSARGLMLATVNVVVILGAAFIVKSLAAGNSGPSSSSLSLPAESEFAFPSPRARAAFVSAGPSSASSASPSAAGRDISAQVEPPSATESDEAPAFEALEFDEFSYVPSRLYAPLLDDSGSWPQLQASARGYGSSSVPSYSHRSGLGGGYSGMGGGFPSSGGGGGGGRPSNAQNSLIDPASAALRSSSGGPTASAAGIPLLPSQAQGNPFLGGSNGLGGPPSFVQNLSSNLGSGGLGASGLVSPTGAGGSSVQTVSVPEPSAALLLGCGLALAAYRNRRRLTPRT